MNIKNVFQKVKQTTSVVCLIIVIHKYYQVI